MNQSEKLFGLLRFILSIFLMIGLLKTPGGVPPLWAKPAGQNRSVKMMEFIFDEKTEKGVVRKTVIKAGFHRRHIQIQLQPRLGEGAFQFGRRVMRDWQTRFREILEYNHNRPLQVDRFVSFPFNSLNGSIQEVALRGLFPKDSAEEAGWVHRITYPDETLSFVAGVFTKRGVSATKLLKFNKLKNGGKSLGIGDKITIPWKWLRDELNLRPVAVRAPLKIGKDSAGKKYATYQLKKGETIYSSVVIRFTDRVLPQEVNRLSDRLLALNQVTDPEKIPLNKKLKIPLEWLSEEYLYDKTPKQVSKFSKSKKQNPDKPKPFQLNQAIHVILDAGHGGNDPGAISGSAKRGDLVYEDEVVYDIMLRMKESLEKKGFIVHPTVRDPNQSKPQRTLLKKDKDEVLLVHPAYRLENTKIGVNLRVYLANHIYQNLVHRQKIPRENILLMSLHGDALHESLRGAMVYYPDPRLRMKVFGLRSKVYRKRKEYKRRIRFSEDENEMSAESSKAFGRVIVKNLKKSGILTHQSKPLRSYHYRNGHRTLPAILRYSKIPTSVLVEVANLNNARDRRDILKAQTRQKIAGVLVKSIQNHTQRLFSLQVASR
ncbi:MAG: N-acetylmuramoyl-L-alanine amidase [SAR324 cluster bacterium]|nr:N-acetylmuramoyl-L-alanine amidase [SAR324 cluster bacterium]